MQVLQFIASDAASALAQIHKQLGPDAVVLSVRPLPTQGMSRLWPGARRIEVLAGLPDKDEPARTIPPKNHSTKTIVATPSISPTPTTKKKPGPSGHWSSIQWLEMMGLLPENAERLQEQVCALHGEAAPASTTEEWTLVQSVLKYFWRDPHPVDTGFISRPHVFVGPAGSGKTTVLCKWLTMAVLTEERRARVWKLDGSSANTAELLSIHCEMLGTPVERFWSVAPQRGELLFVDLPGTDTGDPSAMAALRRQLDTLENPHVHVVLNAAYETGALIRQWEAFAALEPEDLILTHLEEESRRVKLWNLLFGTNCTIRFLSSGQKIPGTFKNASPDQFFPSEPLQ